MKVSVVGCGNISSTHLRILSNTENIEISSVVDIDKNKAEKAAEKYGCEAYFDFNDMLDRDKPDCVHICTPHYLHTQMSAQALERGIHVLCEKPCAIKKDELDFLRRVQKNSGVQFGVCFQNRYNEPVVKAKEIIDSGTYGKVTGIRSNVTWCRKTDYYSDEWHGKKVLEGGGVLVNQAIHTLDLIRYLSSSEVKNVSAHIFNDTLKGITDTEDTATVRYEMENGSVVLMYATVGFSKDADVLIEVFLEKAVIRIEGAYNAYLTQNGNTVSLTEGSVSHFHGKTYWGSGHEALIRDFYNCIRDERHFEIDAFEGGKAVEEFLRCYESASLT